MSFHLYYLLSLGPLTYYVCQVVVSAQHKMISVLLFRFLSSLSDYGHPDNRETGHSNVLAKFGTRVGSPHPWLSIRNLQYLPQSHCNPSNFYHLKQLSFHPRTGAYLAYQLKMQHSTTVVKCFHCPPTFGPLSLS